MIIFYYEKLFRGINMKKRDSNIELLRIIGIIIIFPLLLIILAWSCSMLTKEIINYLSND